MSQAIANISNALGYDAAESMLSSGCSLASVLAFESKRVESYSVNADCSPASTRDATIFAADMIATIAPKKAA